MDYTDEMLKRSTCFEEMVRTEGWKFIEGYVAEKIKGFANKAIMEGFKTLDDYQFYRGEVAGLQSLLAEIEMSLSHLKNYREQSKSSTKE